MRKPLIAIGIAGLLVAGLSLDASADRGRRADNWDRRDQVERWDRRNHQRYQNQFRRGRQQRNGWVFTSPRLRHFGPNRFYRQQRLNRFNRWSRFDRRWGWPASFFGGTALGAAVTYNLVYDHTDHRYCDHMPALPADIGGCYRIERLPDGRERRVELPRSACF